MENIDKQINAIMMAISEIVTHCDTTQPEKMEKLTLDSAKIMVKELHLCILRHTYRVDNIRHNYDSMEDLL